jgi:hypothetical protein
MKQIGMMLAGITKGKVQKPPCLVVYGTEGVGKSTFAAGAPSPIFLTTEDGTDQLDVARFPRPETWQDALDAIADLEGDHSFKTLVVDTLDGLEPLCWAQVCLAAGKKEIDDFDFYRGYLAAVPLWRVFLKRLETLRDKRGMAVVLLAHSVTKKYRNPDDLDFDRRTLAVNDKAAGPIKQWADAVMFARYEEMVHEKSKRTRGVSTGARILHTEWNATWDAKNRYNLPAELPLSWDDFAAAMVEQAPAEVSDLLARIDELLHAVSDEVATKVRALVKKAGKDSAELARIADKLAAKTQGKQSQKQEEKKAS